ncbi:MAG: hypothetical protein JRI85_07950, partial [Deltaproteobacteria bacterium]|nr:hypothetical protein [Deltaproteobacteria bacterium]
IEEKGLSLYGITRHSSVKALRETHTPEQIKQATMHTTNKAFERYFQIEMDDVRQVYSSTILAQKNSTSQKDKALKLKTKVGAEGGI